MGFTKLDENKNGTSEFSYGNVTGIIATHNGDKHVTIRIGNAEINAFCEDADNLLDVIMEIVIQDSRWSYDASLDANANKEPF